MALDDAYSKILHHFDGLDNSVAFRDEADNLWIPVGGAHIHTGEKKLGSACLALDGSDDGIYTLANANLSLATNPFTIDGWVYDTDSGTRPIIECRSSGTSTTGYAFLLNSAGKLDVYINGFKGASSVGISAGVWTHVALVRAGTGANQTTYYVNGNAAGTITLAENLTDATSQITKIGYSSSAGENWGGYIDEFRLSIGIARWTGNFTPLIRPYGYKANYLHARRDRLNMRGVSTQNQFA